MTTSPSHSASATPAQPGVYLGPPNPAELAARLGRPLDDICKLDANESPYGPPPRARAALAALADPPLDLLGAGRYPDAAATELRAALERYTGVARQQIVVGNGSDELIALLSELYLQPGDQVVISEPTFSVYGLAARRRGATVVDTGRDEAFGIDPHALETAITPHTRLIYICSPNNPTGTPVSAALIERAVRRAAAVGAARPDGVAPLVIVDEAYYEIEAFGAPEQAVTVAPLVAAGERVVVLRTFSKLFGLAGLRVGYALCPEDVATQLSRRKEPFNVNLAGQLAARAALDDGPWLRERAAAILAERARMAAALAALPGLQVFPSGTNFLLIGIVGEWADERRELLWQRLLDNGVMVRRLTGERLATTLRITVGTPPQNDRLLNVLGALLREELPARQAVGETNA